MNILIVYAHPNPNSFNAAMREVAVGALSRAGHSILTSDLYAMHFNPVLSAKELAGDLHGIKAEMNKVHRADMLLFQFPDWWYGMPAIMKGWIDRVFAQGFAYDDGQEYETGLLKGKKAMISMTVGYPKDYYTQAPQRDLMRVLEPIHYGYFSFCGLEVLPPYIVYAPSQLNDAQRRDVLEDYRQYLMELHKVKPLVF